MLAEDIKRTFQFTNKIDKFDFFRFVLKRNNLQPSAFCSENGWGSSAHKDWKRRGIPPRVWKVLEKEIKLSNLVNFYKRYDSDIIFLEDLQNEYLESIETH